MTTRDDDTTIVSVRVHPRSSNNRHEFAADGVFHVWVTAAAVDGAANKALLKYLSSILSVSVSRIALVSGKTSRSKRVQIPLSEFEYSIRIGQT